MRSLRVSSDWWRSSLLVDPQSSAGQPPLPRPCFQLQYRTDFFSAGQADDPHAAYSLAKRRRKYANGWKDTGPSVHCDYPLRIEMGAFSSVPIGRITRTYTPSERVDIGASLSPWPSTLLLTNLFLRVPDSDGTDDTRAWSKHCFIQW
jgi:hypothetical protein